jgi:hypothetical protein
MGEHIARVHTKDKSFVSGLTSDCMIRLVSLMVCEAESVSKVRFLIKSITTNLFYLYNYLLNIRLKMLSLDQDLLLLNVQLKN